MNSSDVVNLNDSSLNCTSIGSRLVQINDSSEFDAIISFLDSFQLTDNTTFWVFEE